MENPPGFHDLLNRARSGDSAATDELLALIRPWVEQLARSHGRQFGLHESVSDLVQEAWLRAWQKLDQFQGAADEAAASCPG
jgi:DNA-directed RNA polymerase specialized sigma24 family protein